MAAPITHIVLADKIFDKEFSHLDKKSFFVGTSFPDIRYLKTIDRNKTHFSDVNLVDIRHEESFMAGVKFHSLVDIKREEYIEKSGVYDLFETDDVWAKHASVKVLEDELHYSKIADWSLYVTYFEDILAEEVAFGVSEEIVKKWHSVLQTYISDPSTLTTQFLGAIGLDATRSNTLMQIVDGLRKNPKAVEITNGLYDNFESIIC